MKEQILHLRSLGKSYRQIEKELKCSKGLIGYYLNPTDKKEKNEKQNKNRFHRRQKYKLLLGGKCNFCSYHKCLNALHFHHQDPTQKTFEICDAIWGRVSATEAEILLEVKKCILLCANCHAEIHAQNDFSM